MHAGGYGEPSGDFNSLHRPLSGLSRSLSCTSLPGFQQGRTAIREEELHYLDGLTNLYTHRLPCYWISALDGTGVDEIKQALEGK